jgi:hypothetical protein
MFPIVAEMFFSCSNVTNLIKCTKAAKDCYAWWNKFLMDSSVIGLKLSVKRSLYNMWSLSRISVMKFLISSSVLNRYSSEIVGLIIWEDIVLLVDNNYSIKDYP